MVQDQGKSAALDAALTAMFKDLESRGLPEHLRNVVDQLDGTELPTPSPSPSSSPEP